MAAPRVTVWLPPALLRLFPDASDRVEVEAASIHEMMDELDARWPGIRGRLCDERPAIRRHINVFVDGRRTVLDDLVAPGSEVYIFTAMSGG